MKLEKLIKMVMRTFLTKWNLLIVQNLCQVYYQLLWILSQNELKKIKSKICKCFLEYESVRDNLMKCKFLSCNKDYWNKIDEELKSRFRNTFTFSNNDINELFFWYEKVFILMSIWMNGKKLIKHHCKKKNDLTAT